MRKPLAVVCIVLALVGLGLTPFLESTATYGAPRAQKTLHADRIVASRIELVDNKGRQRAVLTVDKDDAAFLILTDTNEKPFISMEVKRSGAATLALYDRLGRSRVSARVRHDDAYLIVADKRGKGRAEVATRGEDATFFIADTTGRKRIIMASGKGDNAVIGISDRRGKPIFMAP